jgi:hypothetical protein
VSEEVPKRDEVKTGDVELVLRRAAEIQAKTSTESPGTLADRDVVQLAEEIGISRNAVDRALVELRSGALERSRRPQTLGERLYSPAEIVSVRTVPGSVDEVDGRLREFLSSQRFSIQRNFGDELLWKHQRSTLDTLRSFFDSSSKQLEGASELTSAIVPTEDEGISRVILRLELGELRGASKANAIAGSVTLGGLVLFAGTLAAVFGPLAWLPISAALAAAISFGFVRASRSTYRKLAGQLEQNVEGFLDRLEHDPKSLPPAR